jgi:cell division protein FtsZ
LLEDIDLSGAKGILVNITAGMNLTMGEFDEVGNTVRDFADDDATVVLGTVIDPELEDELRVTVVATGLGARRVSVIRPTVSEPTMRLVPGDGEDGGPDYRELDRRPAIYRQGLNVGGNAAEAVDTDLDYLDIPAFLRRQAD